MRQNTIPQAPCWQLPRTTSPGRKICLRVNIAACFLMLSCTPPAARQPPGEAPPPLQMAQAQADPSRTKQQIPPPDLTSIQEAVRRVFKDRALIDTARRPSFVAGDFNGDLSQDIAVVVKPAPGKVSEMNEDFPPWILESLFASNEPRTPRLRVLEDEFLLAVIHGFGPDGWRDPQATQTYLLKNAVGSEMQAQPGKEFVAANQGRKIPRLNGDLIGQVLKGTSGFLYYGSATYSWYDPKTYKGEFREGAVHSGLKSGMKSGNGR